ncbi:hypothetical protein ACU4GR_11280 [Methylobacterium oryzae CBMB20]
MALAVFASLGLGLALPFLLLTLWPPALRALPRPGAWMETLKQVLAFPVYATVAWLIWVLAQQVDPRGLLAALIGLVLVGFAAWVVGARPRGASPRRRPDRAGLPRCWRSLAVAALALSPSPGTVPRPRRRPPPTGSSRSRRRASTPWSTAHRPVFVDLTAAWCITCAVNEATSLNTSGGAGRDGRARRDLPEGRLDQPEPRDHPASRRRTGAAASRSTCSTPEPGSPRCSRRS